MSDGKISSEEFERLRQENQRKIAEQKGLKVNITVDNESQKFAEKQAQSAEERAEELQEKLDLIAEAQSEKLLNDMGITDPEKRFELKSNPDMLIGYKKAHEDAHKNSGKGGSGSAPLNQQQITGGSPSKQGYDSTEELIEDLQSRSRQGDKSAEQVLGQLLEKTLQGVKQNKKGFGQIETPENETEIQRINRINREKHIRNLNKRMEGEN